MVLKRRLHMVAYLALFILLAWLSVAASRVYFYTRQTASLIDSVEPYQQIGQGGKSILFIGESFGYGTGASSPQTSLAGLFGRHLPAASITNKSLNGTKTTDLAARINSDINKRYDLIVVLVGSNDIIHAETSLSRSGQGLAQVYQKAAANASAVIAVTSGDFADTSFFLWPLNHFYSQRSQQLNQAAQLEAAKHANLHYIDAFRPTSAAPKPQALEAADHLHLNDTGNSYWFRVILKQTDILRSVGL